MLHEYHANTRTRIVWLLPISRLVQLEGNWIYTLLCCNEDMAGYQVLVIPWFQGLADSIFTFSLKTARTYQYITPHKNFQFTTGIQLIISMHHSWGNNMHWQLRHIVTCRDIWHCTLRLGTSTTVCIDSYHLFSSIPAGKVVCTNHTSLYLVNYYDNDIFELMETNELGSSLSMWCMKQ